MVTVLVAQFQLCGDFALVFNQSANEKGGAGEKFAFIAFC